MFDIVKIGKRIKDARIAKNMTQMNLADEMGVSFQAVSNWERGNSMPDISKLSELCNVLGISYEDLFGTDEKIAKVLDDVKDGKTECLKIEDIADFAPIVPPDTFEKFTKDEKIKDSIDMENLAKIAPYLDEDDLSDLVKSVQIESPSDLTPVAPFMDEDDISEIVKEYIGKSSQEKFEVSSILPLLPFMDEDEIAEIAKKISGLEVENLAAIAPFMNDDDLEDIIFEQIEKNSDTFDFTNLTPLMPFLDAKVIKRLAARAFSSKYE